MPQLLTRRQTTEDQRSVAGLPSSPPQRRNMRSPSARNRKLTERQLGKAIHNEDRRFGNSKSRGSVRKNIAPQILARLRGKIRFSKPSRGGNAAPMPQALKGKPHSSLSVHVHMNNAMFIEEGDALKNYKTFLRVRLAVLPSSSHPTVTGMYIPKLQNSRILYPRRQMRIQVHLKTRSLAHIMSQPRGCQTMRMRTRLRSMMISILVVLFWRAIFPVQ